jgi:hypothetical protein
MHGFAKRGLALAAATSGLVLGTAAVAAADSTATGDASHSGGIVSGNVGNAAASIPVNFCGNTAVVVALKDTTLGSMCDIASGESATATGSVDHSAGIGAGNDVNLAGNVPVNVCGNEIGAGSIKGWVDPSTCTIGAGGWDGATATGSSDHSGGFLAGNVLNGALSVPINACGNQVEFVGLKDTTHGSTCSIG